MNQNKNNSLINGFFWAIVDKGGQLCLQFSALIILSRILTPYDFGVIGVLTVFINISVMLIDSGMVGALIKKKNPKKEDYSTLFIFNFSLSFILVIIFHFTAPFISSFYGLPELDLIIRVLSISIIFNALGLIQVVKITKELNFKRLAVITLSSQILSVTVALIVAMHDFGVWALVALQVSQSFFNTFLLIISNRYIPSLHFSFHSFKEQFTFGAPLLGANLLNVINTSVYTAIIGKVYPISLTGYFTQSLKLQTVPTNITAAVIDKVAFTMLSKQNDNLKIIEMGRKINSTILNIVIPIFCYVILCSKEIFVFVLGEKWINASWIFGILSFALIPTSIKIISRNLLKSGGFTKMIFKMEVIITIISFVLFSVALLISFKSILFSIVLSSVLSSCVVTYFVSKAYNYNVLDQVKVYLYPLLISLAAICMIKLIVFKLDYYDDFFNFYILLAYSGFVILGYMKFELFNFKYVFKK